MPDDAARVAAASLEPATDRDVAAIAALRTACADALTARHGRGHWSAGSTERAVALDLRRPGLFVVRRGDGIVASLRLQTKKPWAIDVAYFTPVRRPLYLVSMVVDPAHQRLGLGRRALDDALRIARDWPADAIRLDAYDAEAGAGGFYAACGFVERGRVAYRGNPLRYYERLVAAPA